MDQIDTVRAFLAVAEIRSFTAAADRLGLSKALVSKHIALLENRVGARLLNRSTRSVSMTEAGLRFAEKARDTVAGWDLMMEAATEDEGKPHGLLRIAGPKVFSALVLGQVLAEFLQHQPNLRLELAFEERRVDMIAEGYDIAIRMGTPADSSLIGVPLMPYPYVFCASPDYLERRGVPEHPEALRHHDCIINTMLTSDGQWRFAKDGETIRLTPNPRVTVNTATTVADFVAAGHGIGLCIQASVQQALDDGRLVCVLADWNIYNREVFALLPHRQLMPAKTRLLLDFLKRRLAG